MVIKQIKGKDRTFRNGTQGNHHVTSDSQENLLGINNAIICCNL